jgi:hypothetical protein
MLVFDNNSVKEVVKSFQETVRDEDVPFTRANTTFCSWERLKPILQDLTGVNESKIVGIGLNYLGVVIYYR